MWQVAPVQITSRSGKRKICRELGAIVERIGQSIAGTVIRGWVGGLAGDDAR
jgi:uncharacterized protein YcfJ